eukprot:m.660570 g.660570  ORF g.660570 m.660570 type:complete len:345 (-) comp58454_c0_seq4:78-1112(-)
MSAEPPPQDGVSTADTTAIAEQLPSDRLDDAERSRQQPNSRSPAKHDLNLLLLASEALRGRDDSLPADGDRQSSTSSSSSFSSAASSAFAKRTGSKFLPPNGRFIPQNVKIGSRQPDSHSADISLSMHQPSADSTETRPQSAFRKLQGVSQDKEYILKRPHLYDAQGLRRPRAKHRELNLDNMSLPQIAQELLGVEPSNYKTLTPAERNLISSAKYRQKKVDRERELRDRALELQSEALHLQATLRAIESDISLARGHVTAVTVSVNAHQPPVAGMTADSDPAIFQPAPSAFTVLHSTPVDTAIAPGRISIGSSSRSAFSREGGERSRLAPRPAPLHKQQDPPS